MTDHPGDRPDPAAAPDRDADAEAMAAVAAGDADAFEAVVQRHQDAVFRFLLRMGIPPADAEDLAQDVFVRIFLRARGYAPTARFATFLYRIARNAAIDHARRRKRRGATRSLDAPAAGEGRESAADRLADPADARTPLERAEDADARRAALSAALDALPAHEREVFALAGGGDVPYADVAAALDIPVGTVKSRMHAAVHRLRDHLRRHGWHG